MVSSKTGRNHVFDYRQLRICLLFPSTPPLFPILIPSHTLFPFSSSFSVLFARARRVHIQYFKSHTNKYIWWWCFRFQSFDLMQQRWRAKPFIPSLRRSFIFYFYFLLFFFFNNHFFFGLIVYLWLYRAKNEISKKKSH